MRTTRFAPGFCAALLLMCAVAPSAERARQPARVERGAAPNAQAPAPARSAPLLGDRNDGSRARPVHLIPLRDHEGEIIRPTDRPLQPFSTRQTCGADCHDVATIARGWHFNMTEPQAKVRRGEPWILVDPETATQLPLSYHGWPGTYDPARVGLTPWAFASMFGGRTPGGVTGAREPGAALQARWVVSGDLEVNCLACHDASAAYDHAEYGRQVRLENFRWAPAAASGFALVTGSAKEMPNTFDYLLPSVEDALRERMPSVTYAPDRFLPGGKVVFDLVREVPARRCYFCHSTADVAETGSGRWNRGEDIHLARGMTCVDCHRNGLDHAMNRGYEGERTANGPAIAALTCRGCHLATEAERNFARGRFGAPYPQHAGLPPIHLEKLSCTACHSGPRPDQTTRAVKTSLAHRLGGLNVNKADAALPHLYYPVFAQEPDGKTGPNRIVWPAFWGRLANGAVDPIAPADVKRAMAKARVSLKPPASGSWPSLDEATVRQVLAALQTELTAAASRVVVGSRSSRPAVMPAAVAVYVAGGKLHRLDASGRLTAESDPAAQPYLWPIAHDVRPASLALGARGCSDCHEADSPLFAGTVPVDSPLASDRTPAWTMHAFQKNVNAGYAADFARTFQYRPWLKGGSIAAVAMLLLFVLAYAASGLRHLSGAAGAARWTRLAANLLGFATVVAGIASGYQALLSGERLTGYPLMIHVAVAPAFVAGAILVTLFWAGRNGFVRADWNRMLRPFGRIQPETSTSWLVILRKLAFWVALAAAIPATASMTLAMFPVAASIWQGVMIRVHRYSVVALILGSALFTLAAFASWVFGSERAPRDGPGARRDQQASAERL